MQRDEQRAKLAASIASLAKRAIFGTISETYRTCGSPGCRCHGEGPKHGPHMYVSFRGAEGKTTGFYVPEAAHTQIREGVMAWQELQQRLRVLAEDTRERTLATARSRAPRPTRKRRAS
jgi:hypothetical protein